MRKHAELCFGLKKFDCDKRIPEINKTSFKSLQLCPLLLLLLLARSRPELGSPGSRG